MFYVTGDLHGKPMRLLVLETDELETILEGERLVTPDGEVFVCWTHDMSWMQEKVAAKFADCDGEFDSVDELIALATKRPANLPRLRDHTRGKRKKK